MRILKSGLSSDILTAAICVIAAFSLQIQITLFSSPTYLGLRINLTDLIAPVAGLFIIATLIQHKSRWPDWHIPNIYPWLAVLTALLATGLVHTHFTYGEISRWALINKFGGWLILLTILGMGAWVATNACRASIERFLKYFLCFALAVLIVEMLLVYIQGIFDTTLWFAYKTYAFTFIDGLMANRNAYGLLLLTALPLATCLYFSKINPISSHVTHIFYFLLPSFILFNGSRATFLALCLITPLMFFLHRNQRQKCLKLVLCFVAGIILLLAAFQNKHHEILAFKLHQFEFIMKAFGDRGPDPITLSELGKDIDYPGDSMRLTILEDSIEMVNHKPVFGSGLGSMLIYQEEKHGKMINLIDCTPLWILVEMGAIGLMLFALFYIQIAKSFYHSWKQDEEFSKTIRLALMIILFAYTFMCLFHEMMYVRAIWFLLGLGLALPSRMRQA